MDTPIYLFTYSPKGVTKDYDFTYMDHYNSYFKEWHLCMAEYEINPELNQSGNLHYHGYYKIKDKYKWYKKVLPKMKYNGLIKINEVMTNFQEAIKYGRKDREFMLKIMAARPLPLSDRDYRIVPDSVIKEKPKTIPDYFESINLHNVAK